MFYRHESKFLCDSFTTKSNAWSGWTYEALSSMLVSSAPVFHLDTECRGALEPGLRRMWDRGPRVICLGTDVRTFVCEKGGSKIHSAPFSNSNWQNLDLDWFIDYLSTVAIKVQPNNKVRTHRGSVALGSAQLARCLTAASSTRPIALPFNDFCTDPMFLEKANHFSILPFGKYLLEKRIW